MHHISHHNRSAGRSWCWHSQSSLTLKMGINKQSNLWPEKTLRWVGHLFQKVPHPLFFFTLTFLLCQSEVFHQAVCVTVMSPPITSPSPKRCPFAHLSAHVFLNHTRWSKTDMLVYMTDSYMQSYVKPWWSDERQAILLILTMWASV